MMYRHLRYVRDVAREIKLARDIKLGMGAAQVEVKDSTSETRNNLPGQCTLRLRDNRMKYYRNVEMLNDDMLQIETDAMHKREIDIQKVNRILQQSNYVKDYRFGPRVYRLLAEKQIQPSIETFEHLVQSFVGRQNLGFAHSVVRMLEEYGFHNTPELWNTIIRGYLQHRTKDHHATGMCWFWRHLERFNVTNIETYVVLLRYGPRDERHIKETRRAMLTSNIQQTVEYYQALIVAYINVPMVTAAKKELENISIPRGWQTPLGGTFIETMANTGYVQEALDWHETMQENNLVTPPTAVRALIKNIVDAEHEELFARLLTLVHHDAEWDDTCKNVAIYYLIKGDAKLVCDFMQMGLEKWPDEAKTSKAHYFDEIFFMILVRRMSPGLGMEILRIMKRKGLGNATRKGLDLMWDRIYNLMWKKIYKFKDTDWGNLAEISREYKTYDLDHSIINQIRVCDLVWNRILKVRDTDWEKLVEISKEYKTSDLDDNIMNQIRSFEVALFAKDFKLARAISDSMASSHPAVWSIKKRFLHEFASLTPSGLEYREKVFT